MELLDTDVPQSSRLQLARHRFMRELCDVLLDESLDIDERIHAAAEIGRLGDASAIPALLSTPSKR